VLNVCKAGEWPEIRVKGEFLKAADRSGSKKAYGGGIRSKFSYEIEIERKQLI